MAKRAPSSQPKNRRTRVPSDATPAQAADAAIASTDDTIDDVSAVDMGPTEDDIRERAYRRFLQRGGGHGQDFEDWLEAERELRTKK